FANSTTSQRHTVVRTSSRGGLDRWPLPESTPNDPYWWKPRKTRLAALQSSIVGDDTSHTTANSTSSTPRQVLFDALCAKFYVLQPTTFMIRQNRSARRASISYHYDSM
ncbi:unnamed protein product, partial [Ectocarpus sp. 12 AP-2014]